MVCREGVAVTQTGCVLITAVPMQTREPRTNWYPRVRSWGETLRRCRDSSKTQTSLRLASIPSSTQSEVSIGPCVRPRWQPPPQLAP